MNFSFRIFGTEVMATSTQIVVGPVLSFGHSLIRTEASRSYSCSW